jgi:hypothetical protein
MAILEVPRKVADVEWNVGKNMGFTNNTDPFFRIASIPAILVSYVERHLRCRTEEGYEEVLVV